MTEKTGSFNQRIDPDQFYVSNGQKTVGGYQSEDRAHRRKARWNDSPESETWMVFKGSVVRDDDDIPLPE